MASIKPLPLIPETKAERYLLLQSSNQHRASFVFATSAPKKSKVFAFSNTSTRGFSFCSDKRGGLWRIQNVKTAGSGYSGDESNNESDDSLHATIEKSKKVLAIQKQLLEQIAERKKMVSSIKSSIADPEEDLASYEQTVQTEDSVSDSDVTSTDGNILVEAKNGSIPPTSNVQQHVGKVPKVQPSAIIKDSNVGEKESRMDLPSQKAYAYKDSPKESANTYRQSYMSEVQGIEPSTITKDSSAAKKESRVDAPPQKAYAYKDSPQDSANTYRKSYIYEVPGNQPSARTRDSGVGEKQSRIESSPQKAYAYKDSPQDSADTYRKSYMHEVPGNQPSSISRDSKVGEKLSRITSPPQKADPTTDSLQELTNRYTRETSHLKHEELVGTQNASVQEIKTDADDPATADSKPPPLAGVNVMNVILVAAECAPWIKTGGLGDVAGALPKALARRGHRVMVVVPRYGDYKEPQDSGVRKMYKVNGQDMEVRYFQAYIDGVDFVFIDSPMFRHLEKNIYGGKREDILKRMVLFCKAAVEVPWHVPCGGVCYGDGNLVFIANDWHTALLPVYLKAYYRDNGLMKYTRSVLVIHNIAHQGRGPVEDFSYVDLPGHYIDLFKLYDPVGGEHFNIFAAGLKTADRVATVSHGYSWELKTSEGGWGLHNIINEIDWKFRGIVNGIDTKEWSPQYDIHLTSDGYTNYSLETLKTGKPRCKAALQKELGLPVRDDIPLIGFIGRLDHQKGVDLIAEAIPWMMGQDVQLVMLGTGRPDLEQMLRNFENQHRDKVRGWVGFSVKTSHRITAGADVLLMPSRFEPCGLNQLYAMSYGTIPVVHAVGGLRDTVQPFNPFNESGLGWTFENAETNRLIHALGNCLVTFREYKKSWEGLQRRGMMQDLSWDNAAQKYEEVLVAAKYQW